MEIIANREYANIFVALSFLTITKTSLELGLWNLEKW
jgi:hypothetical protein